MKKGFIFSERDKEKKKKRKITTKRGVFCRLNYSICLGNSSFSFMQFWWLVRTNSKARRRKILGSHARRVFRGMTVLVCYAPHAVANSQIPCFIVGVIRKKTSVSLKNTRMCIGAADVLIAAHDWLFIS